MHAWVACRNIFSCIHHRSLFSPLCICSGFDWWSIAVQRAPGAGETRDKPCGKLCGRKPGTTGLLGSKCESFDRLANVSLTSAVKFNRTQLWHTPIILWKTTFRSSGQHRPQGQEVSCSGTPQSAPCWLNVFIHASIFSYAVVVQNSGGVNTYYATLTSPVIAEVGMWQTDVMLTVYEWHAGVLWRFF